MNYTIYNINQNIARFGYTHTQAGGLSDSFIANHDLLIARGLAIDTIYPNTKDGHRLLANSKKRKSTSKQ